jgi:hypothetical protein
MRPEIPGRESISVQGGLAVTLSIDGKISIPDHVMFRELQGESVLLNLDTETYFGLDDVGTRMWAVLAEAATVGQAYEILLEEFDVDPDTLRKDLGALVDQLVEKGLFEISDA